MKVNVVVYILVPSPSTPPAIGCSEVESGNELPQVPDPPLPPAVAPEQLTVTADTGILGQPAKLLEPACTLIVHALRCEPPTIDHDRLAGEVPGTAPASGLLA